MLSYRHAFHAGNHADVLKHMVWVWVLQHLVQKDTPLHVFDTHAGAASYRLDAEMAKKSGESGGGIAKLLQTLFSTEKSPTAQASIEVDATKNKALPEAIAAYFSQLYEGDGAWLKHQSLRNYPGSPALARGLLRPQDRLNLFELHPTDGRLLQRWAEDASPEQAKTTLVRDDGFDGLLKGLPPPASGPTKSRRAAVLIDPSYEIKADYGRVAQTLAAALQKFPTGCYVVWYPIVGRPEAHALPKKLKALATASGKPWLNASLNVGHDKLSPDDRHPPLSASGVLVVNPPHTLKAALQAALPSVLQALQNGRGAAQDVSVGH